jgi:hypothetical protein
MSRERKFVWPVPNPCPPWETDWFAILELSSLLPPDKRLNKINLPIDSWQLLVSGMVLRQVMVFVNPVREIISLACARRSRSRIAPTNTLFPPDLAPCRVALCINTRSQIPLWVVIPRCLSRGNSSSAAPGLHVLTPRRHWKVVTVSWFTGWDI